MNLRPPGWPPAAVAGLILVASHLGAPAVSATPGPWAWGSDTDGHLGDNLTPADKLYPTTISGLSG